MDGRGWYGESYRHSLAARGISTRIFEPAIRHHPEFRKYDRENVVELIERISNYYNWSYFKTASEDERARFYASRTEPYFCLSEEEVFDFIDSGKTFLNIREFDLVGSRADETFSKHSDIDFLVIMDLTQDGYDLITKNLGSKKDLHPDWGWEDRLIAHIEKMEGDMISESMEWKGLENIAGIMVPADVFLRVDFSKFKPGKKVDWHWVDKNDVEEILKRARKKGFEFRKDPVVISEVFPSYYYGHGKDVKSELITLLTTAEDGPNIISLDDVIKEVDVSDLET